MNREVSVVWHVTITVDVMLIDIKSIIGLRSLQLSWVEFVILLQHKGVDHSKDFSR